MRARTFSDESDDASDSKAEPDYVFDGFDVEFSVKIALTPPTVAKTPAPAQPQDAKHG
jgi:predicted AlkP superfamily phosphohydrolase/phosphomutase